jgi:hypothetical protein
MKGTIALMLSAICLVSALGGCIFVPEGGYPDHDHGHEHDHY